MKFTETELTKKQLAQIAREGISFISAVFLEELKIFKFDRDGEHVQYYSENLRRHTSSYVGITGEKYFPGFLHVMAADNKDSYGYLKVIYKEDTEVIYFTEDLSHHTGWHKDIVSEKVMDRFLKLVYGSGSVRYYAKDLYSKSDTCEGIVLEEVIGGFLKLTHEDGDVKYFTSCLGSDTEWYSDVTSEKIVDDYLEITLESGTRRFY